jgi:hypothetical protein
MVGWLRWRGGVGPVVLVTTGLALYDSDALRTPLFLVASLLILLAAMRFFDLDRDHKP